MKNEKETVKDILFKVLNKYRDINKNISIGDADNILLGLRKSFKNENSLVLTLKNKKLLEELFGEILVALRSVQEISLKEVEKMKALEYLTMNILFRVAEYSVYKAEKNDVEKAVDLFFEVYDIKWD